MTRPVKHISQAIKAPPSKVYSFAANPDNLPKWASGLSEGIRKEGDFWVSDSPMGTVRISFAEKNVWGVLDHVVSLPSGEKVLNPLRVLPNDEGSEIVFTLFHGPKATQEEFERDEQWIRKDLEKLKALLESKT